MSLLLISLLISIGLFQVVFLIALVLKNNSVVDVFWGLSFVLHAWIMAVYVSATGESVEAITYVFLGMVSVWGLRLFYHLFKRNIGKPEDWRYQNWRDSWGKWFYIRSWLQIFVLQAVLQWIIALPTTYIIINQNFDVWGLVLVAGAMIWLVGFVTEVIADRQLKQFIKTKKSGDIMTDGIWKYSRHPNYFGEAVLWWGIWIAAFGLTAGVSWWTIVGPITITILVRFVSGVPMLERKYKDSKKFQKYAEKTNVFFPLPQRKIDS